MRVLFLAHAYPRFDGDPVGSFILRLAVSLRDQGIAVSTLAPSGPGLATDDVIEGIPTHRYRYAPRRLETIAYTGTMGQQVRGSWAGRASLMGLIASSFAAASRAVRRDRIDVIHAHWWFPGGLVAAVVRKTMGTPFVTTLHGSDIRLIEGTPAGEKLFRFVSRQSAATTAVSSWLAEGACRIDPASAPVVVPMPVISTLFRPPAEGERRRDRLLFVGKLTEQKGLHHLLRAMSMMCASATLDVVGAGRVDDAHLKRMASELGLADRVNWLPLLSQTDLADVYRRATVLVIPARDEGLGLTAVEALLSETPVVAFASGGIPDIILDGKTGLLVPVGDEALLAGALDRLLADPELQRRFGRDGRSYAVRTFGTEAVAERYARLYRGVLAGESPR